LERSHLAEEGREVGLTDGTAPSLFIRNPVPLQVKVDRVEFAKEAQVREDDSGASRDELMWDPEFLPLFYVKLLEMHKILQRSDFLRKECNHHHHHNSNV